MVANTGLVHGLMMVCRLAAGPSHLARHEPGKYVSLLVPAPQNHATRDSGQILRETLLS